VRRNDMAFSGSTSFNVTRDEIIKFALEDIKAFAPDFEDPPPAAITRANKRLNMMIKAWQAAGVGLWLNTEMTITLVAATRSYLLGPNGTPVVARPLGIVEARYVDANLNELPMTKISRDEYMSLPNKLSEGMPVQYYFDPQLVDAVMYIWPVASTGLAGNTIKMTVRTPIQDFVDTDDNPHFPIEWADALHYCLAMRLIPAYDVPQKVSNDVKELAAITLRDANDFDREQDVAVYFTPEMMPR